MMKNILRLALSIGCAAFCASTLSAADLTAKLHIDTATRYQRVTGFGGFVNSPQFGYNHMTSAEIQKSWGKSSTLGLNIMRVYIPEASTDSASRGNAWRQTVATIKQAKQLGALVFASPWTMPAAWKTNNNYAAVDANGNVGYLKEEHYQDYARYLNSFVTYIRANGADVDAISLQNEPDWKCDYHGCIWTATQMATFLKQYGSLINCRIVAPESIGISNYMDPLINDAATLAQLDIVAGHQYGGISTSSYQKAQAKGKEAWMTEYLINWNEGGSTRNFNWSQDALNFATAINACMLNNLNAWVHYATKRFYGMIGDGQYGTTSGAVTKRGYILAHYAKYVTGSTRVKHTFSDDGGALNGSAYLSVTGDSLIVMVLNNTTNTYSLKVDLPFYTNWSKQVLTSQKMNMNQTSAQPDTLCRPTAEIPASSVVTLIYRKCAERPASQMTTTFSYPYKANIEEQTATKSGFGTRYKLTNGTATFDHDNPLLSANTTLANGFLKLKSNYTQLVFHVNSVSSTFNYNASNVTLYYVNKNGAVASHNYGTVDYPQTGNFDWTVDLSTATLSDGCTGLIGITCGNYSSHLSFRFGGVYLMSGSEKAASFSGNYSQSDSHLLDMLEDAEAVALDFTAVAALPAQIDWHTQLANPNAVCYVADSVANEQTNVVQGTSCHSLLLTDLGGSFWLPKSFTAKNASYPITVDGYQTVVLPFEVLIPEGLSMYSVATDGLSVQATLQPADTLPAHTPVLLKGQGNYILEGTGMVTPQTSLAKGHLQGTYRKAHPLVGQYVLQTTEGVTSFCRVSTADNATVLPFHAYLVPGSATTAPTLSLQLDKDLGIKGPIQNVQKEAPIYDLFGRRVNGPLEPGLYIRNGKKFRIK